MKPRRRTTVHDRYLVTCPACCGVVAGYETKKEALSHAGHHEEACDAAKDVRPLVFDVMARRGAAHEWFPDGSLFSRREVEA